MPAAAAVIRRYAPIAVVVNDFYRRLHLEDRTTPYPIDEVERACGASGFETPTSQRRTNPPEAQDVCARCGGSHCARRLDR